MSENTLNLGVLGYGNMASAILKTAGMGALVYDKSDERRKAAASNGFSVANAAAEVCERCDVILLSVKPNQLSELLPDCRVTNSKCFVSIAAGVTVGTLRAELGGAYVIRFMPNMPVALGLGTTVMAACPEVPEAYRRFATSLFAGYCVELPENLIDTATALNGSSPAVYYLMAEVMSEAASKLGLDAGEALRLTAHAMRGAAAMLLESGKSPEELRRAVCSPGGTTLAMLDALDRGGFSRAIADGINACIRRAQELGSNPA